MATVLLFGALLAERWPELAKQSDNARRVSTFARILIGLFLLMALTNGA